MVSDTKLVEFPNYIRNVVAERAKHDRKLSFLFFQEYKCAEKGRDDVVLALTKQGHQHLLVIT